LAALVLTGPVLAGCSSSSLPDSFSFASMLGGTTPAANANASAPGLSLPANFECPPVQVRTGAATLTSSGNPAEPTALNMKYQVTIGTTARECRMGPNNTVSLKIGMQGRVILGPEGGNQGSVNVPLRYAVVHETVDTKVISTQLDRVAVAIPPNDTNVLFSHVSEGLEFPMPRGGDTDSYVIYIGFDPAGLEPEPKKAAPRPKAKSAKPSRPTG
jgi:hypothetical protein